jgi:hypothetical protein
MRRVSLLRVDEANTPHRLRMLVPIQRRSERPEILGNSLTSYTETINNFTNYTDSAGEFRQNMHAIFVETCKRRGGDYVLVEGYTNWSAYTGGPAEEIICS